MNPFYDEQSLIATMDENPGELSDVGLHYFDAENLKANELLGVRAVRCRRETKKSTRLLSSMKRDEQCELRCWMGE